MCENRTIYKMSNFLVDGVRLPRNVRLPHDLQSP